MYTKFIGIRRSYSLVFFIQVIIFNDIERTFEEFSINIDFILSKFSSMTTDDIYCAVPKVVINI